jgi:CheY-specific phosphatase CheX
MRNKYAAAFHEAVASTLERFAFTFLDFEEEGNFEGLPEDYIYVVMSFSGIADGSVSLAAPEQFCRGLAANALGVETDATDMAVAEDALKELLNIVCGQLTYDLFGDDPVFDLTVPNARHIDQGKWRELAASNDVVRFWVEEQPLLGRLMISDDGADG